MEIQVKSTLPGQPSRRARPLPDPLKLVSNRLLTLFHGGCRGHVTIDSEDPADIEAYATVRCNLCFETHRERQSAIARALSEVLVEGRRSESCTFLTFVGLSPREVLASNPLASRLQKFFFGGARRPF